MVPHSKLAPPRAPLPAVALDIDAKSQSGYLPNAITSQPRCVSPINRYVLLLAVAVAVLRLLQMFVVHVA